MRKLYIYNILKTNKNPKNKNCEELLSREPMLKGKRP